MSKQEKNLRLTKEGEFLGTKCDFYKDDDDNIYMTRMQIGKALQYKNPDDGIYRIHERNKERLDKFSISMKIEAKDKKFYETILYSKEGIIAIIKISTQPYIHKEHLLKMIGCDEGIINAVLGNNINKKYKQNQLYDILHKAYPNLNIETEVSIDDFRVDFILNSLIIVECDELGHKDRDVDYEQYREWYLGEHLGYEIVRYDPDSLDDLEIFKVISQINSIIQDNAVVFAS